MTPRERLLGDLRRLHAAADCASRRTGSPGSPVRRRLEHEAATLKAAIDVIEIEGASVDFLAADAAKQAAAGSDPAFVELLKLMQRQVLMCLVRRLGGSVRLPVAEVDGTGDLVLSMQVEGSAFIFSVERMS